LSGKESATVMNTDVNTVARRRDPALAGVSKRTSTRIASVSD